MDKTELNKKIWRTKAWIWFLCIITALDLVAAVLSTGLYGFDMRVVFFILAAVNMILMMLDASMDIDQWKDEADDRL